MKASFDLVHIDVCGPFNNTFLFHVHYIRKFTNDYIKVWVGSISQEKKWRNPELLVRFQKSLSWSNSENVGSPECVP
jgi:hypothetical protein